MSKANETVYPCQPLDRQGTPVAAPEYGLTKLELFSAMLMQGLMQTSWGGAVAEQRAKVAVANARALIAELGRFDDAL